MARNIMVEPFLLLESDLVFHSPLLHEMMFPDKIAIASIADWMNGTTVTLNKENKVEAFNKDTTFCKTHITYKTVNIYSFSQASWQVISKRLNQHIKEDKINGYYETIFSELVDEGALLLDAVSFDAAAWYEIDTLKDLEEAVKLFPKIAPSEVNKQQVIYSIDGE
jgi:NDP-sugar pyrophosphorylase family protein